MITRSRFYRLALEANEGQRSSRDDILPVPTLDERVTLYLRAVHGTREFTEEERSNARDVLLDSMAAEITTQVLLAEQSPKVGYLGRETTHGADRGSFLAPPEQSAQDWAIKPEVTEQLPPHSYEAATRYWRGVRRKEAISVAPIARRRSSILAMTATCALVLMVTGGTLGYRWTYPDIVHEVAAPVQLPPPATSPRSLSIRPAPDKALPEQHAVQIVSQRSEDDVLAAFRKLQEEQPSLFGQATLSRIDPGLQSYTARVGPFASERDVAALCLALKASDIQCLGQR
jgi:hypothetical protein